MFRSYWNSYTAIGLILGISLTFNLFGWLSVGWDWIGLEKAAPNTYAEQKCAEQEASRTAQQSSVLKGDHTAATNPKPKDINGTKNEEPDWCDLAAQQSMADSTVGMERAAWAAIFLTIVGVFLVWRTLYFTRETLNEAKKATKAAERTVEATHETGGDQSRAYVNADKAELFWGDRHGMGHSLQVTIKNSGQTPAKWFRIYGDVVDEELHDDGLIRGYGRFKDFDLTRNSEREWTGLAANSELRVPIPIDYGSDPKAVWQRGTDLMRRRKTIAVHAVGIVRYCTIFDEIYESEFWFNVRRPRTYFSDYVGEAVDGSQMSKETPIQLVRSSTKMRTFEYIGQKKRE